jgi:hypothetical protein
MKMHLSGDEIAKACAEYLKRRGYKPLKVNLYSEEETAKQAPDFWAVVECEKKEMRHG